MRYVSRRLSDVISVILTNRVVTLADLNYSARLRAESLTSRRSVIIDRNTGRMSVKCVLVDLSGTIHIDDTEIPGSVKALERLRRSGVHVKFVTNTTKESKRVLYERLRLLGFTIDMGEIFTSLTAARKLIEKRNVRPFLMLDERAMEDFEGISTENPNAVIVGLAPDKFDYNTMNCAFRLVLEGAALIAIHKARYYKRKDSLALGPGPFVSALEYATGCQAAVVGKPQPAFFLEAVHEFDCLASQCAMIGDDSRDDVAGALKCGMRGILVRTGKYRPGDEDRFDVSPTFVAQDFAGAVDFILSSMIC